MGRSMADPNFVYRPRTQDQRMAASVRERRRLGIPAGFCRVYGVDVPEDQAWFIRKYAHGLSMEFGSETAHEWVGEMADREFEGFVSIDDLPSFADLRDSDGTATAADCGDNPVPKDCQARAESIAQNKEPQ